MLFFSVKSMIFSLYYTNYWSLLYSMRDTFSCFQKSPITFWLKCVYISKHWKDCFLKLINISKPNSISAKLILFSHFSKLNFQKDGTIFTVEYLHTFVFRKVNLEFKHCSFSFIIYLFLFLRYFGSFFQRDGEIKLLS